MKNQTAGRGARDRILRTAGLMFYREGYQHVGIDRIIADANVAKASFYRHFPSKDDLVLAWITKAEALMPDPDATSDKPLRDYALQMLDIAGSSTCRGCTFQVAAAEFSEPGNPILKAAREVKSRVQNQLTELARIEGHIDPVAAGLSVYLIIEGVWATVRMFGPHVDLTSAEQAIRLVTENR